MEVKTEMEEGQGKLELIASRHFEVSEELVYVVDFLNKNLKNKHIMFGLSKNKDPEKKQMLFSIYEFD
jgi:hypothetical protein